MQLFSVNGGLLISVVVAAASDGVSHPAHEHHQQADDQENYPDDQENVSEGESWCDTWEYEPEGDEDDSEDDHEIDLVSACDARIVLPIVMRIPLLLFDGSVEALPGRRAGRCRRLLVGCGARTSSTLKPSAVGPAEVPNKNSAPADGDVRAEP